MTNLISRHPKDSEVVMTQIVLPGDANALGTAFGGKIMQWIDIAAAVAARRHSKGVAVTASIDSLHFERPVQQGDVMILRASVNRAWKTSMEVGVRVDGESLDETYHAATAYLTFVAINKNGDKVNVSPILPQSEVEKERYRLAEIRRKQRLETRKRRRNATSTKESE